MKVKVFSKCGGYFEKFSKSASILEEDINDWLNDNPGISIIEIKQSSCGGSLEPAKHIVSIWYEAKE